MMFTSVSYAFPRRVQNILAHYQLLIAGYLKFLNIYKNKKNRGKQKPILSGFCLKISSVNFISLALRNKL